MMAPIKSFFVHYGYLLLFLCPTTFAEDIVVGIYGDIHGNAAAAEKVLDRMKAARVSHIIGTGDFIEWGGTKQLDRMLSMISERTGVTKNNTFLMPGNWEHETNMTPETANGILAKYGNLITSDYAGFGYIKIHGQRIMVSHFPQHRMPKEMFPDPRFLRRIRGQEFVLDSAANNIHPTANTAFEIFAHTHIGGHFIDPISGKTVINVGTLHEKKKSIDEPLAFALYYPNKAQISFFKVGTDQPIQTISLAGHSSHQRHFPGIDGCATLLKDVGLTK